MARICSVICTSHTPFLFADVDEWERARTVIIANGMIAPDVPFDSREENEAKWKRCQRAFEILRDEFEAASPDVVLIFGDDQLEQFDFSNFPAFALFVGPSFEGYKISRWYGLPVPGTRSERPKDAAEWARATGHPVLARSLMVGLMRRGFDLAFSQKLRDEQEGMGHAFMRPAFRLAPAFDVPVVPFFVNCYYGPQPTGRRCYELGRAVRSAIESLPEQLNVCVVGSGGLWHTPRAPMACIDHEFDGAIIEAVRSGNAREMAQYFDSRVPAYDIRNDQSVELASGGTSMVLGYGSGTGETRNWIAAAAVADGVPGTIVDYVPINASPIGAGFAFWRFPVR